MIQYKEFTYTKTNGEVTERKVLLIAKPSKNYLCIDVEDLTYDEIEYLQGQLASLNREREAVLSSVMAGYKSFKPEGIEWKD